MIDPTLAKLKRLINVAGLNTIMQTWEHPERNDIAFQLSPLRVNDIITKIIAAQAFVTGRLQSWLGQAS